ncbi:MAG TPA: sulfur carrier protein ThiS [Methyloceanibacter sp.]|nr:sulfur carrier protein ThiS [Methyloceanibacter sp.]
MQILLNGKRFATEAINLDELCESLGFADAKIATAVNGSFVAASERKKTALIEAAEIEIVAPRQGG